MPNTFHKTGGKNINAIQLTSRFNPQLEVSVFQGHFATRHSHNSHYIDITRMKHEFTMAREAAMTLAQNYAYDKGVDTIVCLDGSEVIGAFLARHLAKKEVFSVNSNKNINVVTPEYDFQRAADSPGQPDPHDRGAGGADPDLHRQLRQERRRTLECVQYYGGKVQGIAAIFSMLEQVDGIPVYSLFSPDDIAGYISSSPKECPMCRAGQKIDALANSFGLSML